MVDSASLIQGTTTGFTTRPDSIASAALCTSASGNVSTSSSTGIRPLATISASRGRNSGGLLSPSAAPNTRSRSFTSSATSTGAVTPNRRHAHDRGRTTDGQALQRLHEHRKHRCSPPRSQVRHRSDPSSPPPGQCLRASPPASRRACARAPSARDRARPPRDQLADRAATEPPSRRTARPLPRRTPRPWRRPGDGARSSTAPAPVCTPHPSGASTSAGRSRRHPAPPPRCARSPAYLSERRLPEEVAAQRLVRPSVGAAVQARTVGEVAQTGTTRTATAHPQGRRQHCHTSRTSGHPAARTQRRHALTALHHGGRRQLTHVHSLPLKNQNSPPATWAFDDPAPAMVRVRAIVKISDCHNLWLFEEGGHDRRTTRPR